jgi:hypothetical protein
MLSENFLRVNPDQSLEVIMHEVKITREYLEKLRMLADWQIVELGFDVMSVTLALTDLENPRPKPKFFPSCS